MRLKASDRVAISPGAPSLSTRALKSPPATWPAAFTSRPIGAEMLLAADIMDVTPQAVVEALEKHQVQRMIHGHTHRPDVHQLEANGKPATRIVLGDWYEQGSVLVATSESLTLENMQFSE